MQIGNTRLDITPLQVYGPLRPRLTLGPVQRNPEAAAALNPSTRGDLGATATSTLTWAFIRWYGFGHGRSARLHPRRDGRGGVPAHPAHPAPLGPGGSIVPLDRDGDLAAQRRSDPGHERDRRGGGAAGLGRLRRARVHRRGGGLQRVRSLADLVGTYHLSPSPVGPPVRGYAGAVIGDSRASRVGGPPVAKPTDDDIACARSADSLADEIGALRGERVLNLACSGASIARGLRGPQPQGGRVMAPQSAGSSRSQACRTWSW